MSSRSSYRKIQQSETNAEEYEELKKRTRAERLDRITAKIHAVFWVAAAIAIFIFTDILNVALYNEKVNRYAYCYQPSLLLLFLFLLILFLLILLLLLLLLIPLFIFL